MGRADEVVAPRHRALVVLRGSRAHTARELLRRVAHLPADEALHVGPAGALLDDALRRAPGRLGDHLGSSRTVVSLDLHDGPDPDALGRAHGLVRGGGCMVLRLPDAGDPAPRAARLVVPPHTLDEVGTRMVARLEAHLRSAPLASPAALRPAPAVPAGSSEQEAAVARLLHRLSDPTPSCTVLLADRGRGKSSALGLALSALARAPHPPRVAVTGPSEAATAEITARTGLCRTPPGELLDPASPLEVLVVDEAARLPVPLLRRVLQTHPRARLAFATTTRGYEGTGRGFVLRFLAGLRASPRPLDEIVLHDPIRWDAADPLEAWVHRLLALHAVPSRLSASPPVRPTLRPVRLSQDRLAEDEALLHAVFGLLVHAHYRTTPGDLHRLLDAPNLELHALLDDQDRVWAANLLAVEGGLSAALCRDLARGRRRIRGQALADTLVSHATRPDAGTLRLIRSVRLATHPDARRQGLARRLVEAVQSTHADADAVGTVFSATPDIVRLRQALGYEVVRVGVARSSRSGEPAVVMLRPHSAAARELVADLRVELARGLDDRLERLERDGGLAVEDALRQALGAGLPAPTPWPRASRDRIVGAYAFGPRPLDAATGAVRAWLEAQPEAIRTRPEAARLARRVVEGASWAELAAERGLSVHAVMRALRRDAQALWTLAGGSGARLDEILAAGTGLGVRPLDHGSATARDAGGGGGEPDGEQDASG